MEAESLLNCISPFCSIYGIDDLEFRSEVIDCGTNRKRVYVFLLVVNSNLDPILHRFRDTAA